MFFLQKFVIFNMITDSILVEKRGTLMGKGGTSKNKESFGNFFIPFCVKYFDRKFKYFLSEFRKTHRFPLI